jgi:hypothetical protein
VVGYSWIAAKTLRTSLDQEWILGLGTSGNPSTPAS